MCSKICIFDFEVGNINSVINAFNYLNIETVVTNDIKNLDKSIGIVLPGNGNFNFIMKKTKSLELDKKLFEIKDKSIPILGICIGFQILFETGKENFTENGLGFVKGNVDKIDNIFNHKDFKLPNIGWNKTKVINKKKLFSDLSDEEYFYYLHSLTPYNYDNSIISSFTNYGMKIVSSIEKDHVCGVQFHPEKSHKSGLKILNNWINYYVKI